MSKQTAGIHHITAFAGNAQLNVDFYAGILGLRLVKKTVNFDAPDVYHLYYGNEIGSPGTAMTTFPFEGGRKGRIGGGQVGKTTFVVPEGSIKFWENRLTKFHVAWSRSERFGEQYIQFEDPDGLLFEITERHEGTPSKWEFGGIPVDHAIKGFGGAVLYSVAPNKTMHLLEHVLGMERVEENSKLVRFRSSGDLGNLIDVNIDAVDRGSGGSGTVHHIAWRAIDKEDQEAWREKVIQAGFAPTPILDRQYFTSIYFREHGGILFEIATDGPGFDRDESIEELGEQLKLPEWYEPFRVNIVKGLPPLKTRVLEGDSLPDKIDEENYDL